MQKPQILPTCGPISYSLPHYSYSLDETTHKRCEPLSVPRTFFKNVLSAYNVVCKVLAFAKNRQINLKRYNTIRKDRNRRGGGVALYIQEHLLFKVRDDLCVNGLEILWIQIHLPFQQPTLIGCIYRPPKSDIAYLDKICKSIGLALDERRELFMLGDCNINWKNTNSDGNKTKFTQYIESLDQD